MVIVGVDPGPVTHGAVIYDSVARRVLWSDKSADWMKIMDESERHKAKRCVIERPAAMGGLGTGKVGHMLDTAWEGGRMAANFQLAGIPVHELTRRQVLRELGVMSVGFMLPEDDNRTHTQEVIVWRMWAGIMETATANRRASAENTGMVLDSVI